MRCKVARMTPKVFLTIGQESVKKKSVFFVVYILGPPPRARKEIADYCFCAFR